MKTAVSIPDDVFEDADQAAAVRGWSRSELYTRAVRAFLEGQGDDPVTAALDRLVDEVGAEWSPGPARALIDRGDWSW